MSKEITYTLSDKTIGKLQEIVGGGGATIVDALPASGKEGTTYLLRKGRPTEFTARAYFDILDPTFVLVTNYFTANDLKNEIFAKLHINPDTSPEYINISSLEDDLTGAIIVITEEEFNQRSSDFIIVDTEEDLPTTDPEKLIFQDLGELTVNSFRIIQSYDNEVNESIIELINPANNLCFTTEVNNSTLVGMIRHIYYNESGELIVGEWEENYRDPIAESLVDQIVTDLDTLQQLGESIIYIKCSYSAGYVYSYIEYVFDKGVYTEITAKSGEKIIEEFTVGDLYEYCSNKRVYPSETDPVYHYNINKYSDIFYRIMNFLRPIEEEQGSFPFIRANISTDIIHGVNIVGFELLRDPTAVPMSNYFRYILPNYVHTGVSHKNDYPTIDEIIANFELEKTNIAQAPVNQGMIPLMGQGDYANYNLNAIIKPRIYIFAGPDTEVSTCLGHIDITIQDILDLIDKDIQ